MTATNRRLFLQKTAGLPLLSLATGFHPRGQAQKEDILYARRLPRNFSPNHTHIFSLNSRGRDRIDRYTVYEPPVSKAFYHLRNDVSAKWNPLCQDPEQGLLSKGIELYRIPKNFYPGTYGRTVAYALSPDALHNIQIILTRLEIPTRLIEI
jgi:hypothetical protein